MNGACDFCKNEINPVEHRYWTGGFYDIVSRIPFIMPFTCKHCGGSFCEKHRLPENHDCFILDEWNQWGAYKHSGLYQTSSFPSQYYFWKYPLKKILYFGIGALICIFVVTLFIFLREQ